jgi:hypothetical protein
MINSHSILPYFPKPHFMPGEMLSGGRCKGKLEIFPSEFRKMQANGIIRNAQRPLGTHRLSIRGRLGRYSGSSPLVQSTFLSCCSQEGNPVMAADHRYWKPLPFFNPTPIPLFYPFFNPTPEAPYEGILDSASRHDESLIARAIR